MKLVLALLFSLLIISGCGCKTDDDCSASNDCFTPKCVDSKCTENPKPNCCGNSRQDKIEDDLPGNKCTCPQDYGICDGSIGKYRTQGCIDDICYVMIDEKKVSIVSSVDSVKSRGADFKVQSVWNQPFNIDRDTFKVKLELSGLAAEKIEVNKLELYAQDSAKQLVLLAEKELSRSLWQQGDFLEEEISLNFPSAKEAELSSFKLVISYQALTQSGEPQASTAEVRYKQSKFSYADPEVPRSCPACDDGNPATVDSCSPDTGYFCRFLPITGKCGNSVCDSSEDKCTCTQDCGPCTGSIGDYMVYSCNNNKCVSRLGAVLEQIARLDDRALDFGRMSIRYQYTSPFSYKTSSFRVEMKLEELKTGYSNINLVSVAVMDGDQIVAESAASDTFSAVGDTASITVPVTFQMAKAEERRRGSAVKIWYTYEQKKSAADPVTVHKTYSYDLGKLLYIYPEVEK